MRQYLAALFWPIISGILLALVILNYMPGSTSSPAPRTTVSPSTVPEPDPDVPPPSERAAPDTQTGTPLERTSGHSGYSTAVERAAPSVVNIYSSRIVEKSDASAMDTPIIERFFSKGTPARQRMLSSLGSGVIVSDQGYVLTNNHVIQGADEIQVALRDGRETIAHLIGADPDTDLAVLKIDMNDLPVATLAVAHDTRVGDIALAIGNPYGVGQTVTMGIVSALGRNHLGLNAYEDFIQTDAAINPGNSGGALINTDGAVIGINTAIFSRTGGSQGIGFAIPINAAQRILDDLVTQGRVIRGWLGIEAQEISPALANSFNLHAPRAIIVSRLIAGGPADKAGVRQGDILLSIDGKALLDAQAALVDIANVDPGRRIPLTLYRDGKEMKVSIKVAERPVNQPAIQKTELPKGKSSS
ncbi:S1C family serine protease [Larsenimonas rhizosphaerae]|uniref:Trypsin-like peptidase domain-containing protein n=1 Tax=Larsenimonas rhizosphaerae TaxID=2944682 RepID=A0AA41ZMT5_9GAMM|nr:trypsin-like peptidase domain-containing protein [Larsenimonas rhizosphaerae]MCM2131065.1 trypsin-like peptidase domain-containing protein [Larsenimonas rhizosphaerae]MCX2523770.1 trypsin-like peptidase domain-containing protein [Larsenimonas rhizosphaerae]